MWFEFTAETQRSPIYFDGMEESEYHICVENRSDDYAWDDVTLRRVYAQVFRTNFKAPGVALLSFREEVSSKELRSLMCNLKMRLSTLHQEMHGKHLVYLSMGRFDSQVTTKFHLDGAPDEAFLMLGYEASQVKSELSIADYSRAAYDWNITPQKLLTDFNPMFADNEKRLLPYITQLTAFNPAQPHILLLNNSSLPYAENSLNFLGVMHQATIVANSQVHRIINSTMISTALNANNEPIDAASQKQFLETSEITGAL